MELMNADAENPSPKLIEAFQLKAEDAEAVAHCAVQYALVLEEGIAADLISRSDSELDKAQLAARLLRCVPARECSGQLLRDVTASF